MPQLLVPRLMIIASGWLLLAGVSQLACGEDMFGYSTSALELVAGPQSTDDDDAPPVYIAPLPTPSPVATPLPSPPVFRSMETAVAEPWSWADLQVTNQTRQALSFYGGVQARATLSEMPRRAPVVSNPSPSRHRPSKPFQTISRDPTVSPYMNLYREDDDSDAGPNYFSLVRPQMEQIETNRFQQRELQQLRRQVQNATAVVGPQYQTRGMPGTGHVAHFMDTAQFYSQGQR